MNDAFDKVTKQNVISAGEGARMQNMRTSGANRADSDVKRIILLLGALFIKVITRNYNL